MSSAQAKQPTSKTLKSPKLDSLPDDLQKVARELIDKKFPVAKVEADKKTIAMKYAESQKIALSNEWGLRPGDVYKQEYGVDYGYEDSRYIRKIEVVIDFIHSDWGSMRERAIRRTFVFVEGTNVSNLIDTQKYKLCREWDCVPSEIYTKVVNKRRL